MSLAGSTPAPSAGGLTHLRWCPWCNGSTRACGARGDGFNPRRTPSPLPGAEATMTRDVLERPTLVLNRNWQPVHVTTVVRALVLLWNDVGAGRRARRVPALRLGRLGGARARATASPCIRAARLRLRVPEVICLARYDRLPGDGGDLQPAERGQARPLHLPVLRRPAGRRGDHDRPRRARARRVARRAGPTASPPASRCNARKADRTPEQAGMRLRKPPGPARVEAALRGAGWPGRELGRGSCRTSRPWLLA